MANKLGRPRKPTKWKRPPVRTLEVDPFLAYSVNQLMATFRCSRATMWRCITKCGVCHSHTYPFLPHNTHTVYVPSWELWKMANSLIVRKWIKICTNKPSKVPRKLFSMVDGGNNHKTIVKDPYYTIDEFLQLIAPKVTISKESLKLLIEVGLVPYDYDEYIPNFFVSNILE